jgi:hypothetical protein
VADYPEFALHSHGQRAVKGLGEIEVFSASPSGNMGLPPRPLPPP